MITKAFKFPPFFLFLLITSPSCQSLRSSNGERDEKPPVHQLRIYEIFDENNNAFHLRFKNDAKRIMAKCDFTIISTWESKTDTTTEFVYLLQWPDTATMKAKWQAL